MSAPSPERLQLARGQVLAAALAVSGMDENLRTYLECLDGIARLVASGGDLTPLAERAREERAGA